MTLTKPLLDWLLDSDPAIRWQVLRDLMDAPADVVAVERARVATEGWGARMLDDQGADGSWGGGAFVPRAWTCSSFTLGDLASFGLDPTSERARRAIGRVRGTTWGPQFADSPFFEGEVEPCINGRLLASAAYFGEASDKLVERLLGEQLEDGGWNCEAPKSVRSSFHSTIAVLEGLLGYERAKGAVPAVTEARRRGEEYLLERRMFRRRSTGEVVRPEWTQLAYPMRWHYDILWGLDYLRRAGVAPDARVAEAIELLATKRDAGGRWRLETVYPGAVHVEMEAGVGQPSRWLTHRALRVLDWSRRERPREHDPA